jgi:hypothetical protein
LTGGDGTPVLLGIRIWVCFTTTKSVLEPVDMTIEKTTDTSFADACRLSAASQLSIKPKHHEQYVEGQFAGAWHQSLWSSQVDQREIWAEKQAIEASGGFVISVGRTV